MANPRPKYSKSQQGNIFGILIGAVGLLAALSLAAFNLLSGPIQTASRITNITEARNDLIINARVLMTNASDSDGDGAFEAAPYNTTGTAPTGGGTLPTTQGLNRTDPWGNLYGYCSWDHGSDDSTADMLDGPNPVLTDRYVIALISAGEDGSFDSTCRDYLDDGSVSGGDPAFEVGGDDLYQTYSMAEAASATGGLWSLSTNQADTATYSSNVGVGTDTVDLSNPDGGNFASNGNFQVDGVARFANATLFEADIHLLNNSDFRIWGTGNIVMAGEASPDLASDSSTGGSIDMAGGTIFDIGTLHIISDRKFKHDIAPISDGLQKVRNLKPVSYYWNENFRQDSQKHYGLIAQELETVLPETVRTDPEGHHKSVDYNQVLANLIQAVQELDAENQVLKEKINQLAKNN